MTISAGQCRAARAFLNWTRDDLQAASKVSARALADFELENRQPHDRTLADIVKALEKAGIAFSEDGGVRMKRRRGAKSIPVSKLNASNDT